MSFLCGLKGRLKQGDQKRWSTMSKRKSGSMLDAPKAIMSFRDDAQQSSPLSRSGRPSNLDLLPPENPNAAHTVDLLPSLPLQSPQMSSPESWSSLPSPSSVHPLPSVSFSSINSNPPPKPPRLYVNAAAVPRRRKRISDYFGHYENIPDLKSLQNTDIEPELSPMSRTYPRSSRYKAIESRDSRMLTDEFLFAQHRQILEIMRYVLIDRLHAPDVLHHLFQRGVISEQEKEIVLQEEREKTMNIFIVDELFTKGETEFEEFKHVLRLNEDYACLADILEVLEIVFKMLEENNGIKAPEEDSGTEADVDLLEEDPYEIVGEALQRRPHFQPPALDAAHMHCDISYFDREKGEMCPIITLPTPPGYFPRLTNCDNARESVALAREFMDMIEQSLQFDYCPTDTCDSPDRYIPVISLDIYDQNLGDEGASVLASLLGKYKCVSELSIPKNCIESEGMTRLASALQVNTNLLKLDIRMNPVTNDAARAFADALRINSSLKCLNLTDTKISHKGCSDIMQNLVENGTLRELDLGFNDLNDGDCDDMAELLETKTTLKKLRLRGNDIAFLGCRALCRSLERNTCLIVLDLSSNDLGDNAAFHIGTMLSRNTTLQFLNLEKCGFTKEAAGAIAQSLTENKTLLSLDLGRNLLEDAGAEALAAMLSHNNSLKSLDLNMCEIGRQGFLALLEALDNNTSLSTLKLCFNEIGRSERRTAITELHQHGGAASGNVTIMDSVYDRLHSTLVYKRDLRLLLWGNKLDEKRYSKEVRFEK